MRHWPAGALCDFAGLQELRASLSGSAGSGGARQLETFPPGWKGELYLDRLRPIRRPVLIALPLRQEFSFDFVSNGADLFERILAALAIYGVTTGVGAWSMRRASSRARIASSSAWAASAST
jgi:hypothetical protein